MQITTPTGTYKWIGDKWGRFIISNYIIEMNGVDVIFTKNGGGTWIIFNTNHTPEQLVKLGYMELIETKPEEKPTYWYIETEEMKKSEYWEVFKEWFNNKTHSIWYWNCDKYGFDDNGYDFGPFILGTPKLSPQQWYDTIYQPDHDKAMEIPEVPEDYDDNPFTPLGIDNQRKQMAKSLNAVIKKINNL